MTIVVVNFGFPHVDDYPELDPGDPFFDRERIGLRKGERCVYWDSKSQTVRAWTGSWDDKGEALGEDEIAALTAELKPYGYTIKDFPFWGTQPIPA